MISVVQKPFHGPEGQIASGTVIDTTGWKNEQRLHNCRFLRPASADELEQLRAEPAASLSEPGATQRPARSPKPAKKKVH